MPLLRHVDADNCRNMILDFESLFAPAVLSQADPGVPSGSPTDSESDGAVRALPSVPSAAEPGADDSSTASTVAAPPSLPVFEIIIRRSAANLDKVEVSALQAAVDPSGPKHMFQV